MRSEVMDSSSAAENLQSGTPDLIGEPFAVIESDPGKSTVHIPRSLS